MVQIRPFQKQDLYDVLNLFYRTVHAVNRIHYQEEQLCAWAPYCADQTTWLQSLLSHRAFVAIENDKLLGFGDCDNSGYLDRLYCAFDHQHSGIGTLLTEKLEQETASLGIGTICTEASITARSFFESHGYRVLLEQKKSLRGQDFINYKMVKELPAGSTLVEKTFGEPQPRISYEHRPGAYGIVQNSNGEIGVIQTPRGYFLIGGGFEANETAQECLKREFLEETGYDVQIEDKICVVASYTKRLKDGRPFHPIAHCYRCSIGSKKQVPIEKNHILRWLSPQQAATMLVAEHQRYAIQRTL